jgi:histidinol-phosphate aminotransferase
VRLNAVLGNLTAYHSGPPLETIRERYGLDHLVKLASNECPEGPFPEVVQAIAEAVAGLNRYPDGGASDLRSALAARVGVTPEQLVFGNGSCELLMLLGEALLGPGTHVVFPDPSFVVYRNIAMSRQASFAAVPLMAHHQDLGAMLEALTPDTRMVIVCNPNNPTGTYVPPEELLAFLRAVPGDVVVVLDEAYAEYVTDPRHTDSVAWLGEFANLIILRTFSKIYGLAGLRVGYGITHRPLAEAIDKIRQPFNLNALAQVAATTALAHPEWVAARRDHAAREKSRIGIALDGLGIERVPSEANFLFLRIDGLAVPAKEVPQALLERGVMTRSGYAMGCPGWLRLTIGSTDENDLFLRLLTQLAGERTEA